ncbi:DNA polymerase III psi subunit [Mesocricetibacter intestinalis]|uniref:DNA polymerase III subunit psi n=1 Tax=Mesocricetibacter intestinalis TaxID=1521930 RepID=A0A4R6VM09_9PAST|nr:DNA polymerase III subunit psi [Mesocricetibacter intestinalis]TDQ59890.1 DNA polymerase III psi subunit [Mesocricetibacter intestinalis]
MNRRDLLLQEMGISQWQLHRPQALKGAVNIPVAPHIALIIIAEKILSPAENILSDILSAAALEAKDCLCIDFIQAGYLHTSHPVTYWLLSENSEKVQRTLPLCKQAKNLWRTSDLAILKQSGAEKRRLWQQIQCSLT